ncbi:hypothetical protein [Flavisphingomonas formosensis]|uniref:hypothetical protein n=1 Tax=Flavisphingomonas formosensis TaxID=861534 RepID=UPI0012F9AB45|nr:hypothetical protein [Sphingomonas formosensis]
MIRRFTRFACIDWSGAKGPWQKGIALACCDTGTAAPALIFPAEARWSRQAVLDWLLERAAMGADMLVGVDFSAALPFADTGAYFPDLAGSPADARALWRHVDAISEDDPHLAASRYVAHPEIMPYFRVGAATGPRFASADRNGRLRAVERLAASGRPTSCFNLVGASQVGLSSLTGMRVLHRLAGRIPVWPFDPVPQSGPLIVEIYTSIAAIAAGRPRNATKMTNYEALNDALALLGSDPVAGRGPIDDHSSDALLTAAWLRRRSADPALWDPQGLKADPTLAHTEGWTFGVA